MPCGKPDPRKGFPFGVVNLGANAEPCRSVDTAAQTPSSPIQPASVPARGVIQITA